MRRFVSLAVLVALAGPAAFAATPATKVVEFKAYDAHGHLAQGLTVVKRVKADCSASLTTVRPDAWRCFATSEHTVYDPCFSASPSAKQVACPTDYFHHTVVVVTLKSPLEQPVGEDAQVVKRLRPVDIEPWILELDDGATCVFIAGATFSIKGERANYECSKDGWIIGYTEEVKPEHWVAHLADDQGNKIARTRAVKIGIL
jgi:hypothetical protein